MYMYSLNKTMISLTRALDGTYQARNHYLKLKHLRHFVKHNSSSSNNITNLITNRNATTTITTTITHHKFITSKPQIKLKLAKIPEKTFSRHRHFSTICTTPTASKAVSSSTEKNDIHFIKKLGHRQVSTSGSKMDDNYGDPSLAWKLDNKVYDQGPDQILPSKALYTWHPEGAVELGRYKKESVPYEYVPKSVPGFFKQCVNETPQHPALRFKKDGQWQTITLEQYYNDIRVVAKAFIALGLERNHSVCILGYNSPEWFLSNFGAIFAGGISAGVYVTNNPDAVADCGVDSRANIFVVQDDEQLAKVLKVRKKLKELKAIIKVEHDSSSSSLLPGVIGWNELMKLGQQTSDSILEERLKLIALNQCCTLIYTSGTTGKPKGVMLSHNNFRWSMQAFLTAMEWTLLTVSPARMVSYLPLSHIAGQLGELYCPLYMRGTVYFADKHALQGTLIHSLREIQPTVLVAVPRVYEKMHGGILEARRKTSNRLQNFIVDVAKAQCLKRYEQIERGVQNPRVLGFKMFDKIIFSKVRQQMGLGQFELLINGAAPLSVDTTKYLLSFNLPIYQVFGMSETTGLHTFQNQNNFRLGSNGKVVPGQEIKILKPNEEGHGEIALGGTNIMMGYLGLPDKTKQTFSPDGFLFTGDIGYVDADGFLFYTGREKDILVTAGGENVAPVEIEERVKSLLTIVSQAALVGDQKKCLAVLLTLKTTQDSKSEPTNKLTPFVQSWIAQNGELNAETLTDVLPAVDMHSNHKLRQAIEAKIQLVNQQAISRAQHIRNWCILPNDFTVAGGELGPTLKFKRPVINKKYTKYINDMYAKLENTNAKHE